MLRPLKELSRSSKDLPWSRQRGQGSDRPGQLTWLALSQHSACPPGPQPDVMAEATGPATIGGTAEDGYGMEMPCDWLVGGCLHDRDA